MQLAEIIVYFDSDTKHMGALLVGEVVLNVKVDGTNIYHCALRDSLAHELKVMKPKFSLAYSEETGASEQGIYPVASRGLTVFLSLNINSGISKNTSQRNPASLHQSAALES
jgi:hypothetical protein